VRAKVGIRGVGVLFPFPPPILRKGKKEKKEKGEKKGGKNWFFQGGEKQGISV